MFKSSLESSFDCCDRSPGLGLTTYLTLVVHNYPESAVLESSVKLSLACIDSRIAQDTYDHV